MKRFGNKSKLIQNVKIFEKGRISIAFLFLCDLGDNEGVADEDGDVGDDLDEDDLGPHSVEQEVPMVEAKV